VRNTITPLVSRETSIELIRVLAYPKFKLSAEEIQAVLNAYLPYAEIIIVPAETASNTPICRDQNDQMFIDLAVVGHAAVLVSGDKDLLDLASQTSFVIESPTPFKLRFD
jgi:putative PIN family toxin of toxin-antitoxin system